MYTNDQIEKILADNEYFGGLDRDTRRAVAEICLVKALKKNDVLFHEGQNGYAFFMLLDGAVRVARTTEDGREAVIKLLKPGEIFGEVILFETADYPARAQAAAASTVLVIPKKQIHCLLEGEPFRRAFLGFLMGKLRYLTDRLLEVSAVGAEERFFRFLEGRQGRRNKYDLGISKKEIAGAIGVNPETFSRLLARLEGEGRIAWRGKTLSVRWE